MSLSWAEFISFWANWTLVGALIVGVVATYGIVVSGNVKEDAAKIEIAAAGKIAEEARKDAGTANEKAANLALRAAQLEDDAANAQKETARLSLETESARAEIASANARAAEASRKAEQERVARLKIEERIAPRRLSKEQQQSLTDKLKSAAGRSVAITSYAGDAEASILAGQIKDAIQAVCAVDDRIALQSAQASLAKGISVFGDDAELVAMITEGLLAAGITDIGASPPPESPIDHLLLESSRDFPPVAATVMIGVKPIDP